VAPFRVLISFSHRGGKIMEYRPVRIHFDAVALERLIRHCWAKVEWGHGRILVRDGANEGWISYMLKGRQKSEFDGFLDCIIIESLHNPIVDA
jgi:hypothetical protein